jgi:hypothetical protein
MAKNESNREFADRMVEVMKKLWWASDDEEIGLYAGFTVSDLRHLARAFASKIDEEEKRAPGQDSSPVTASLG